MNRGVRRAGFVVLAFAVLLGWRALRPADPRYADSAGSGKEVSGTVSDSGQGPRPRGEPRAGAPVADGSRRIVADWNRLLRLARETPDVEDLRGRLLETRGEWLRMDPSTVAETIGGLLRAGEDRPLGMPFEVGNHGFLAGWPSLRVFLLDVLAGSDPDAASAIAREVLAATHSADEYVVALRPLTRAGTGRAGDDELLARFDHMLSRDDWAGGRAFAEGFDLVRVIDSPAVVSRLCGWDANPRLRNAALHELAAEDPSAVVSAAADLGNLPSDDRARLMARADPTDPAQAATLDAYLRDAALEASEAAVFLKVFPLRSSTTGYRLYAASPRPYDREELLAGDHAALAMVDGWLADPALAPFRNDLAALRERIVEWLPEEP